MPAEPVKFPLRFEVRVLLPVIAIMALLLFATLWTVRQRFNTQIRSQTEDALRHAELVFQSFQRQRARFVMQGYVNLANEPRVKSIAQLADRKTAQDLIANSLLTELGRGTIFISRADGEILAGASSDATLKTGEVEPHLKSAIEAAVDGEPFTGLVHVGTRLFDVTSVPIKVAQGVGGVITFVDAIGSETAWEFKQLTGTEVVLFEDYAVIASTLNSRELEPRLTEIFRSESSAASRSPTQKTPTLPLEIGGKWYQVLAARAAVAGADKTIGHLLLLSHDGPMRALESTQSALIGIGVVGVVLSGAIIWMLLRTITRPLRQLRAGAEAVGRGDLKHQVPVTSRDECGALAAAFNQMTANLSTSHEQLEQTVDKLKTTREQLLQSEKLSAIGEFVAGVTHELNNPLTTVIGFAELARQPGEKANNKIYLDNIVSSAQRCHKIVQSLLSFARQHTPEKKPVNVNELLENTLNFLQYEMRTSNVDVQCKFASSVPKVWADPYQLQQVFLNIINNARHAMEDLKKPGQITIVTGTSAAGVRIQIQDNGPGISAANMSRIFDPFFTTKAVGKGTGLGLSVTYGIIQEHGGNIRAESQLGEGATFIIDLPVMPEGMAATAAPAHQAAVAAPVPKGQRILVVDDESMILNLVQTCLTREGYQVDIASDGETALKKFRGAQYDLILCDWKMPGYNGREVFEQIKAIDSAASHRIVFMTGDVINASIRKFHEDAGATCLSKPFSMEKLKETVRETIEARDTNSKRG